MSNYLLIDIGAGTMDIMWVDMAARKHYKAVVISPVLHLARHIRDLPSGDLLVTGGEMGGGAVSRILAERARQSRVVMSASAAMTVHHDTARVAATGIEVVSDAAAEDLKRSGGFVHTTILDLDPERISRIVSGFGAPCSFDAVAVCVQDHGRPPEGVSHLDYRHGFFQKALESSQTPAALLYAAPEVPAAFNRLSTVARSAALLPASRVYVMDSGMAAILGARMDPEVLRHRHVAVVDVATSHTVAAIWSEQRFCSFFEYHTRDMSADLMEHLLPRLADGRLKHEEILQMGGHGVCVLKELPFERIGAVVLTGPNRRLLAGLRLPTLFGAPMGDNMMTGTAGLLAAVAHREEWELPMLW